VENGKGEERDIKKAVFNRLYGDCSKRFLNEESFLTGEGFSLPENRNTIDIIRNRRGTSTE